MIRVTVMPEPVEFAPTLIWPADDPMAELADYTAYVDRQWATITNEHDREAVLVSGRAYQTSDDAAIFWISWLTDVDRASGTDPMVWAPGESHAVEVLFRPLQASTYSGTIYLVFEALEDVGGSLDTTQTEIPIACIGKGVGAPAKKTGRTKKTVGSTPKA